MNYWKKMTPQKLELIRQKVDTAIAVVEDNRKGNEMNDRELLELAAKAAGVDGEYENGVIWYKNPFDDAAGFNPLRCDGDALRLAVKLNMGISIPIHRTIRADVITFKDASINVREGGDDPYAATRRAIVRAAAEIGKAMK